MDSRQRLKKFIIESVRRSLNEQFGAEQTPDDVMEEIENMRSNMFEMPNGAVLYIGYDPQKNELYCGGATNSGIIRDHVIEYDLSQSLDYNLEGLYETALESGEYYDENEMVESIVRKSVRRVLREMANDDDNYDDDEEWRKQEDDDELDYDMKEYIKAMQKSEGTYKASSSDGNFQTGDKVIVHTKNMGDVEGVITDFDTNFMTFEETADVDYDNDGRTRTMMSVPLSKIEKIG